MNRIESKCYNIFTLITIVLCNFIHLFKLYSSNAISRARREKTRSITWWARADEMVATHKRRNEWGGTGRPFAWIRRTPAADDETKMENNNKVSFNHDDKRTQTFELRFNDYTQLYNSIYIFVYYIISTIRLYFGIYLIYTKNTIYFSIFIFF